MPQLRPSSIRLPSPSLRRLSSSARALAVAVAPLAIALLAVACESEEAECTKDEECNEITCPDGSKMQTCESGVCLQGDDCEAESTGGW